MSDIVGLSIQLFSLAIKAYEVLQKAIEFPESYSALVLKLDVELTRLQLWGRHSGISQGLLLPGLAPLESLINRILQKLYDLLQDTDKLKEKYGLIPADEGTAESESSRFHNVRNVLRSITGKPKITFDSSNRETQSINKIATMALGRVKWVISSERLFKQLVEDIRSYTNNLNELLQESQRTSLYQDWRRTAVELVGGVDDPSSLLLVRQMAKEDDICRDVFSMASRKAIAVNHSNPETPVQVLKKEDFILPANNNTLARFIALYNPKTPSPVPLDKLYVLVERKRYTPVVSTEDKVALLSRLQRLISLLNTPSENDRGILPTSLGYWSEPENYCWCLVYQCPFSPSSTIPPQITGSLTTAQPLSLLHLLQGSFRPALELRWNLASHLATVLSRLYGGQWLHKAIRSDNIVFPHSSSPDFDVSFPHIVGFEYSRQYTEPVSIDFIPQEFSQALYRHPDYQGDEK
ncbi:hypothetical protein L218DRAFT_650824 [Marasmius fiardii PR-910]|nr:hypothetical protein L218DRAFT_650824 [Marasmius fiardii PR-910]